MTIRTGGAGASLALALALALPAALQAQAFSRRDVEMGLVMLREVQNDLRRNYYDTVFHGMDTAALFGAARLRLDSARSNTEIYAVIAQTLFALDDSHTWFLPPQRAADVRYGWSLAMVGDSCFVAAVDPRSDAWAKGLRQGDHVLAVEGFAVRRSELWKIAYVLGILSPRTRVRLSLSTAGGGPRELVVDSRVTELSRVLDFSGRDGGAGINELIRRRQNYERGMAAEFIEVRDSVLVWRLPTFMLDEEQIDDGMRRARRFPALILDLRDNGGGAEDALLRLLGHFATERTRVGTLTRRRGIDSLIVHPRRPAFEGRLIVLTDARSASAAEVFAYMARMFGRAIVLGDRSMGAVQRSIGYQHQTGAMVARFFAVSVTEADLLLADGASLEHTGVRPDTVVLPTSADLAAGRDPVLARALAAVGVQRDAAAAGRLYARRRIEDLVW